jgi:hypothetical protein
MNKLLEQTLVTDAYNWRLLHYFQVYTNIVNDFHPTYPRSFSKARPPKTSSQNPFITLEPKN